MHEKRLAPEELRRILKRAATKEVTWQEIDLVKDHIAALDPAFGALYPSADASHAPGFTSSGQEGLPVTRYTARARVAVADGKLRVRPVDIQPAVARSEFLAWADMHGHSSTCPRQPGGPIKCSPACPVREIFASYSVPMPWEASPTGGGS